MTASQHCPNCGNTVKPALTRKRRKRDTGYSWAEIGLRLGITRQAVHQRWGDTQP